MTTVVEEHQRAAMSRPTPALYFDSGIKIERLHALNACAFAAFTYARYQRHLQALHPLQVAIGAWQDGEPVGLLFLEFLLAERSGNILSIFVAKYHRDRGIGRRLLWEAEAVCRDAGMNLLEVTYPSGTATTAALQHVLAAARWGRPQRKHWICKAGTRFATAPWIDKYPLAKGFSVLPWTDLSEGNRVQLRRGEETWIPPKLNPFACEENLDPVCSLALLQGSEPVGWVLAQQHGIDTLVYGSSFVRPDLRGRGHLISAYAEACRRQVSQTTRQIGIWLVPMIYPAMAAFADRRMRPYLDSVEEFLRVTRDLTGPAPDSLRNTGDRQVTWTGSIADEVLQRTLAPHQDMPHSESAPCK